jgi:Holliday junction resolvase-like predicted endonuclease
MTYSSGAYSEQRARQLIVLRRATVIARNYTSRFGEIDLIVLYSDRLEFI